MPPGLGKLAMLLKEALVCSCDVSGSKYGS